MKKHGKKSVSLERDLFFTLKDIEDSGCPIKDITLSDLFVYTSDILLSINPDYNLVYLSEILFRIKYGETTDEVDLLRKRVKYLKTIPQPEQRTPEWYKFRKTRITASSLAKIVGLSPYSSIRDFIFEKAARGEDAKTKWISNKYMEHGNRYEEVANRIYQHRMDTTVIEFGCIPHDIIPIVGASPDGITPDGVMIEIKCPATRVITGIQPIYYWCQVQLQLEVAELNVCDFVEVKLNEYSSEEEFLEDVPDDTVDNMKSLCLTHDNLEKGIIIEYKPVDPEKKTAYIYFDMNHTVEELLELVSKKVDELNTNDDILFVRTRYWNSSKYSCVRIHRDKAWFQEIYPQLVECWGTIEKIRAMTDEEYAVEIVKYKKRKRVSKNKRILGFSGPAVCLFDDSDSDSGDAQTKVPQPSRPPELLPPSLQQRTTPTSPPHGAPPPSPLQCLIVSDSDDE